MRLRAASMVLACLLAAGCGGSGDQEAAEPVTTTSGSGPTLEQLWKAPGDDVTVVPGTSAYEPGRIRVSFIVVDGKGEPVTLQTARVLLSRGLEESPFLETVARLERIGVPGGAEGDSTHLYVAYLRVREPGRYWLLAEPEGGPADVHALGNVVVEKDVSVPRTGEPAPRSETPTLRSVHGDASRITTRVPPDVTLLRYSVAGSLRARRPLVVTFATPKFCVSRACGPVVDVVEEVARRFRDSPVRFVHVEIYEDLNPALGYNRWVREWGLPTEPWTFVVDRSGKIRERFEGPVSVRELEDAVTAVAERRRG